MPPTRSRPTARALATAARSALALFDVSPRARMQRLHDGENTTWKVQPPGKRRPLVVRLHRANYQSPARIEGELLWLDALGRDLPGRAPTPVRSRQGRMLCTVPVPGTDQIRPASLLTWSPGRFPSWPGGLVALERVGALTACLHVHAQSWRSPAKRRRPTLGLEEHVGDECHWGIAPVAVPGLRKSQREYVAATIDDVRSRLASWDKPRRTRGLIHGDCHLGNLLIDQGRARAIDFDDSARTYFLMDPAVTLLSAALGDGFAAREAAYWRGYRSEGGAIPAADHGLLATFQLVRFISMFAWSYTRSDHPRLKAYHPRRQKLMLAACRTWQRTGGARIR